MLPIQSVLYILSTGIHAALTLHATSLAFSEGMFLALILLLLAVSVSMHCMLTYQVRTRKGDARREGDGLDSFGRYVEHDGRTRRPG